MQTAAALLIAISKRFRGGPTAHQLSSSTFALFFSGEQSEDPSQNVTQIGTFGIEPLYICIYIFIYISRLLSLRCVSSVAIVTQCKTFHSH